MDEQKRETVKRLAYVTPAILTLAAVPSMASTGSGQATLSSEPTSDHDKGRGNDPDFVPPGQEKKK